MTTDNLLLELLVEELPPKSLKQLDRSFGELMVAALKKRELLTADFQYQTFATPRRLAIHVTGVLSQAADKAVSTKLMPVKVGLGADGKATPALLKKLDKLGLDHGIVEQLRSAQDGKMEALFYDTVETGITLTAGLQQALDETLRQLPIAKVMSYQLEDGWTSVNFVRPAHGLVALHGTQVLDIQALGLKAGQTICGHRFEAAADVLVIEQADEYETLLAEQGGVIASYNRRRDDIIRQITTVSDQLQLTPVEDQELLDEVTALVERPNVLVGTFEAEFLQVPPECLILTMKANQKYFPLLDEQGRLSNRFLIVSNITPEDSTAVVGGNERVVRPRLADARFFYDQDRRQTLVSRQPALDNMVYHNQLGSLGQRVRRIQAIAGVIARKLWGESLAQQSEQAASLAKNDLLTEMVGEFPELQGTMGRYYALHDGLDQAVADAIEQHYLPRYAGDSLPNHPVASCLALADKMETLAGLFGVGQKPTGDKDPFALRRQALGVIRILIEQELALPLQDLVHIAFSAFDPDQLQPAQQEVTAFMLERLAGWLRDQGYSTNDVEAVLSQEPALLYTVPQRLAAVRTFMQLPEAAALAAANKRVGNILKKAEGDMDMVIDPDLFQEAAERQLHAVLMETATPVRDAAARGDYTEALQTLAGLQVPVDVFFDSVMVNADDPQLKANRLALLHELHQSMNQVADISRLVTS